MCNLSENIEARGYEKGITKERIAAIERMIKADATKEQILSYGYTEAEYAEAESNTGCKLSVKCQKDWILQEP